MKTLVTAMMVLLLAVAGCGQKEDSAGETKQPATSEEVASAIDVDLHTAVATGNIEASATGDCKIEGMNVGIKANAEFKAEGSAGAKINTSAIAEIKGSLVQIN